MTARLVCRLRAGAAQTFEIGQAEAVLGREAGLAVSLRLDGISRRHARVTWDGQLYWLKDLGSTNGTFINDDKVSITEITDQTEFKIGQTTLMLITTSQAFEK